MSQYDDERIESDIDSIDESGSPLDGDRDTPSVVDVHGQGGKKLFLGISAVAVGLVVALSFAMSGENKDETKLTDKTGDEFAPSKTPIPDIPEQPDFFAAPTQQTRVVAEVAAVEAPPPPPQPTKRELTQAEKQALDAEKAERQRRRKAPIVIYESGGSVAGSSEPERLVARAREAGDQRREELMEQLRSITKQVQGGGGARVQAPLGQSAALSGVGEESQAVSATVLQDRSFLLTEGTMIGGVLETAIQSDLAGKVRAMVNEDIYSEDGTLLLIEKHSQITGQYTGGLEKGQVRIFVVWDRIITPRGVDIKIKSPATGPLGRAGLGGIVDRHIMERFGASTLLSLVGAAAAQNDDLDSDFRQAVGENFNDSANTALEHSIDIPATLHKLQGEKIKIFVAKDVNFRQAYQARAML